MQWNWKVQKKSAESHHCSVLHFLLILARFWTTYNSTLITMVLYLIKERHSFLQSVAVNYIKQFSLMESFNIFMGKTSYMHARI
jgi:hypothetical protein